MMDNPDLTALKQLASLPPEYIGLFVLWQFYRLAVKFVDAVEEGLARTNEIARDVAEIRHAMNFQYPPVTIYGPPSPTSHGHGAGNNKQRPS